MSVREGRTSAVSPDWSCGVPAHEPVPRFAVDDPGLDEYYEANGFAIVRGLLSVDDVVDVASNVERYRTFIAPRHPRQDWITRETDGTIRNMHYLERADPYFADLGVRPELLDFVARMTRRTAGFLSAETFDKPAHVGSAALPHQDGVYLVESGTRIVHLWVPFQPANEANGAMLYWPGSHRAGVVPHVPIDGWDLVAVPDEDWERLGHPVVAAVDPGELIIHHDHVVHGSNPNRGAASRKAMNLCYQLT
jgi:phytanoyl-CoA hydroxylase